MRDELSTTTVSEAYEGTGSNFGYCNDAFPSINLEVLTVSYYDDYSFKTLLIDPDENFEYKNDELTATGGLKAQDPQHFDRVMSLVTGTVTKVLNEPTWLWSVNYYDDHYRVIQSTASNYKGGVNRITNVYDFVGKVLRTKTRYIIPGHAEHPDTKISQRFSYDHAGRLVKTWHQIEGGPEVLLSANEYNELGQLVTKSLHQTALNGTPVLADPWRMIPGPPTIPTFPPRSMPARKTRTSPQTVFGCCRDLQFRPVIHFSEGLATLRRMRLPLTILWRASFFR